MVSITILYNNIMGPLSYMRSVVDRNVVMRHIRIWNTGPISEKPVLVRI